jgi:hypothetical protein
MLVERVMLTPDATEQTSIIETIRLPDIGNPPQLSTGGAQVFGRNWMAISFKSDDSRRDLRSEYDV